ncbi:MAG: hypothetical protein HQK51_20620 [Oligoflexia bacterium]|nr:hypothetical protein [Oligoflexia bacterium]
MNFIKSFFIASVFLTFALNVFASEDKGVDLNKKLENKIGSTSTREEQILMSKLLELGRQPAPSNADFVNEHPKHGDYFLETFRPCPTCASKPVVAKRPSGSFSFDVDKIFNYLQKIAKALVWIV